MLLDLSGNFHEAEQGQADGGVLMAQNGSLVYYSLTVNNVFAIYRTMQGATVPNGTQFPVSQSQLNAVLAFASAHSLGPMIDSQALAIEIRSQVRAARNRMAAVRARADYYRRVVLPLRAKVVDQTQLQFNGMFASVFQLLQAKQAQIDAGREYLESLRNYWIARSELEKAAGGSLKGLSLDSPSTMPAATQPMPAPTDAQPKPHQHGG